MVQCRQDKREKREKEMTSQEIRITKEDANGAKKVEWNGYECTTQASGRILGGNDKFWLGWGDLVEAGILEMGDSGPYGHFDLNWAIS